MEFTIISAILALVGLDLFPALGVAQVVGNEAWVFWGLVEWAVMGGFILATLALNWAVWVYMTNK